MMVTAPSEERIPNKKFSTPAPHFQLLTSASNAANQRARERHWPNHQNCASRASLHWGVRPTDCTPRLRPRHCKPTLLEAPDFTPPLACGPFCFTPPVSGGFLLFFELIM